MTTGQEEAREGQSPFREIPIRAGNTEAKIAPERGGTVTSFSIGNVPILYLDRDTLNDPTKNVRGGIPILFPNAGPLRAGAYDLPQHGFARRLPWSLLNQTEHSVTMMLNSAAETKKQYPFDFKLQLKVGVTEGTLSHEMVVTNTGTAPMPTAYGIHPYFEIQDDQKTNLVTNIHGFETKETDWTKDFDQSFANLGATQISIAKAKDSPSKEITIESDPSQFQIVYLWHQPGKNFVCIEPWTRNNNALNQPDQSLWINPGQSLSLPIIISVKSIK